MDTITINDDKVIGVRCFGKIAHVSDLVSELYDEPKIIQCCSGPEQTRPFLSPGCQSDSVLIL